METIDHRAGVRLRRPVPMKLKSTNVRACTKMKARRLIIDDDSSTEGSVAALQGRPTSAEWAELEAGVVGTEEEGPSERSLWSSERSLWSLEWKPLAFDL